VRTIASLLQRCAERAAELRVRLTIESEPTSRWGPRVGSDFGRLARIVETANEWCEARGIPPVAAITIDLEHTLIAHWGRHEYVAGDLRRHGRLIEHVHIVRPLDLFDRLPPHDPRPERKPPGKLVRIFAGSRCPGAHATIAPPGGDAEFEALIIAARDLTNWRRIGVFNLEVMPPWFYPTCFLTRGSRPHEMLASIRLLRSLVRRNDADAG